MLRVISKCLGYVKKCFYLSGSEYECRTHKNLKRFVEGALRFIGPRAVEFTSEHYGCVTSQTLNEFGPILQTQVGYGTPENCVYRIFDTVTGRVNK